MNGTEVEQVAKVETTPETVLPEEGAIYHDAEGRELRVDEVDIAEPAGRQVIGAVRAPGVPDYSPYSTTLAIWKRVWGDKAPRAEKQPGWLG